MTRDLGLVARQNKLGDRYIKNTPVILSADTSGHYAFSEDASSKAFPLTVIGNTTPTPNTPFTGYPMSGSAYFDGTGDYMTTTPSTEFSFGNGNFTIECWFMLTADATAATDTTRWATLFAAHPDSQATLTTDYAFSIVGTSATTGTGIDFSARDSGVLQSTTWTGTVSKNVWHHVAVTKERNTVNIYFNGTRVRVNAAFTNRVLSNGNPVKIGAMFYSVGAQNRYFPGYISNLRVTSSAVYTGESFSVPTAPLVADELTDLLTCQTSVSDSAHLFIDSSTVNNRMVAVGTPTQTSFSPYWSAEQYPFGYNRPLTGGSVYFNGTTDAINSSLLGSPVIGTGDFTIEAWVYPTIALTGYRDIIVFLPGNYGLVTLGGVVGIYTLLGVGNVSTGYTLDIGKWTHLAAVRSAGVFRLYANGIQVFTQASTTSVPAQTSAVIGAWAGAGSEFFPGYISDLRVSIGSATYTSNFTVPRQPLKPVSGTLLMLNSSESLYTDKSRKTTWIESSGSSIKATKRFAKPSGRSMSLFLTGTNHTITPYNANHNLSNLNFTIEAWVYPTTTGAIRSIVNTWQIGGAWIFEIAASNALRFAYTNVASGISTISVPGSTVIPVFTWTHVAVVRNGATLSMYVNGILDITFNIGTQTIYYYNGENKNIRIGIVDSTTGPFNGYISNVRIVKGTAVYTTEFTPPTTVLTNIPNTLYLTGRSIRLQDLSSNNYAVTPSTAGTAMIAYNGPVTDSVTIEPEGGIYFDGTGDYLTSSSTFDLLPNSFTVEGWIFPAIENTGYKSTGNRIFSTGGTSTTWSSTTGPHTLVQITSTGNLNFQLANGTATPISLLSAGTVPLDTWTHFAACLDTAAGKIRVFVNGVMTESSYTGLSKPSGIPTATLATIPGELGVVATAFQGWMKEIRVTAGVARYSSTFTPPTASYPTR